MFCYHNRMTVHFICRGNTLRSVIAEAYLKSFGLPGIETMSSGTVAERYRTQNEPTLATTNALLAKHGLGMYTKEQADQLTQERLHETNITICMNNIVYEEGKEIVTFPKKTRIWDIVDAGESGRLIGPRDNHSKYDEAIHADITRKVDALVRELGF